MWSFMPLGIDGWQMESQPTEKESWRLWPAWIPNYFHQTMLFSLIQALPRAI